MKRAHDIDVNLSAHVMHENLMSKASSVLALLYGVKNAGISKDDVEYVIDCAEEACGDMNLSLIHISEPTRQAEISYAVFCLKKKKSEKITIEEVKHIEVE